MGTYKTTAKWQTAPTGKTYTAANGKKYKRRRQILVYEHGNPHAKDRYWEYKGLVTEKVSETPLTPKDPEPGPSRTDLTAPDYMTPQGVHYRRMPDGTYVEIGGTTQTTSAQEALYDAYTDYLDQVTYYNTDLQTKLELQYEILAAKQGMKWWEKDRAIKAEFDKRKIHRLSYADWLIKSQHGTIPNAGILYEPPDLREEVEALDAHEVANIVVEAIHKGPIGGVKYGPLKAALTSQKWVKGAGIGWRLADALALTRIAAMGIAGMPDALVGSMATSTATYGIAQRVAGQQDVLTSTLSTLNDNVQRLAGTAGMSGENYKAMYLALNDHAKRQGYIKGDWKLRLSRNIPVKERWRRLYITLAAHIEKTNKRRSGKPRRGITG